MDKTLFMVWFWHQTPRRHGFCAEHVNRWAIMMARNLTIPHEFACVTDDGEGIDPSIRIIPLSEVVPEHIKNLSSPLWPEDRKLPQCYRRLALWRRDAEQVFGARRLVSMDIDVVVTGNCDAIFSHDEEVKILKGTSSKRPYNGGLVQLIAGSRPQVVEECTPEGILASSQRYVGSDQAWISHCLGGLESTFRGEQGVYNMTPRFQKANTGARGFMLPSNAKLLFFPNKPKLWDAPLMYPKLYACWAGSLEDQKKLFIKPPTSRYLPNRRMWAYDDPKGWGQRFKKVVDSFGYRGRMFTAAEQVPNGEAAFVRLDQQGGQRELSKNLIADLDSRGILVFPTTQDADWYDDKLAQHEVLKPWMPLTHIARKREAAIALLDQVKFPLISKSAEGAGSANIRLLENADDAMREIEQVFSTGYPLRYDRWQKGYVYWQEIVKDNAGDIRIIVTGDFNHGLRRMNRPNTIFASGSGLSTPVTMKDPFERAAAKLAVDIAAEIGTNWVAFDFVFEGMNPEEPRVLEMSAAWTLKAYEEAELFNRNLSGTGMKGDRVFQIAMDLIVGAARQRTM